MWLGCINFTMKSFLESHVEDDGATRHSILSRTHSYVFHQLLRLPEFLWHAHCGGDKITSIRLTPHAFVLQTSGCLCFTLNVFQSTLVLFLDIHFHSVLMSFMFCLNIHRCDQDHY